MEEHRTACGAAGAGPGDAGGPMHFPRASHLTERETHPGRRSKDTFSLGREAKDL